ncbi:hypothetical protein [Flavobacterium sp. SM2513]|uniref:hypothetical protein n=1 Tax=Flavobacterium sp. SM2513 TaxID=3424766 RepID=UPI003D7FC30E
MKSLKKNSVFLLHLFLISLIYSVSYSNEKVRVCLSLERLESGRVYFSRQQDTVKTAENHVQKKEETKRPFFGKIYTYGLPPVLGNGPCEVGVFKTFYLFGLKISGPRPVMTPYEKNEEILIQEVVGCGEEYIPEKEKDKLDKKERKEEKTRKNKKVGKNKMDPDEEITKNDKRVRKTNDFFDSP